MIDIYEDSNAFLVPNAVPGAPERMFQRTIEGQPVGSVRQLSQLERAQGSRGRSGGQIDAWNAAYGPTGDDGYPRRLWDLETGVLDRDVAFYMRDNGYDLRHHLQEHWSRLGPDLVGKIRIYNPEMDQFYLPYAVYRLEVFLAATTDPYYGGVAGAAGRPRRGCPAGGCGPVPNNRLRYMLIGYARVSKADGSQSLDLQRDALQAAGVDAGHVYHDVASGVRDDRPGLDSCVRALRTGDVLVVWKRDHLGRTLAPPGQHRAGPVGPRRGPAGDHRARRADRHHHGGRRFALSKAQVRLAQATMAHRDTSVSARCRELGINPVTLYRYVGPQDQLREQGEKVLAP